MKNLQKHLSTISNVKSNLSRPILQNVHYSHTHQALFVTDSFRLLKFNTPVAQTFSINPLTFELLGTDSTYPEVNRLIPTNYNEVIHIDSNHITPILIKTLKLYKKSILTLDVNYTSKQIDFYDNETFITSLPFEGSQGKEPVNFFINAKYLTDTFTFMLDYHKENPSTIILGFVSPLRPFTFSSLEYIYLLTTCRRNKL